MTTPNIALAAFTVDTSSRTRRARHEPLPSALAATIKHAVSARGSYRSVARELGISPGHLCNIANRIRCPSVEVARLLALVLDLDAAVASSLMELAAPDAGRSRATTGASQLRAGDG